MKKTTLFIFAIIFIFTSCQEVIDIEVPTEAPRLVIEASFKTYFNETPVSANTTVKLSTSTGYFEEIIPTVNDAKVYVTNLSNNTIINYENLKNDGNYTPVSSFIPKNDIEYELTIIYNQDKYVAKTTKIKTPLFTVKQGTQTLFTGKETQIIVNFIDDATTNNYYLFNFDKGKFFTLEDRFFNGSNYSFSTFYSEDDVQLPEEISIEMNGITKNYFTYFQILRSQGNQNSGRPFQSAPTTLLGNILNTSNNDSPPLGYFHISETAVFKITLK